MRRFFTSDWHLGSTNIIGYAGRPFSSASDAAGKLVGNCNSAAGGRSDIVFHVGDFWLHGSDRHDRVEDVNGLTASMDDYIGSVVARLVLLTGNHDESNCETDAKSMTVNLNQNYVNVTVAHYPSYHQEYRYVGNGNRRSLSRGLTRRFSVGDNLHIHLCGHVHDKWLLHYDTRHNVLNVNVGVDVWDYGPVCDSELTALLDFVFGARVRMPKDTLTRVEVEIWKRQNECVIAGDRAERKAERYARKGLTPEERERRRVEAMKKKGLL